MHKRVWPETLSSTKYPFQATVDRSVLFSMWFSLNSNTYFVSKGFNWLSNHFKMLRLGPKLLCLCFLLASYLSLLNYSWTHLESIYFCYCSAVYCRNNKMHNQTAKKGPRTLLEQYFKLNIKVSMLTTELSQCSSKSLRPTDPLPTRNVFNTFRYNCCWYRTLYCGPIDLPMLPSILQTTP